MNWSTIIDRYIAEGRTVSGAKGDKTANNTEVSQGEFTKTLQGMFAQNNAKQQGQLDFLNQKLQSAVTNPQGYSPQTLAAMRTQTTEQGAQSNKDVMQAVNGKFAGETGATALPNGVQEQVAGQTEAQIANQEATSQLNITEQNGQLQNQNEWKAIEGEQNVAQLENPTGFASSASNAAGTVSNLSDAVTKANGPGWGSILGGVVSAGLNAAGQAAKAGG